MSLYKYVNSGTLEYILNGSIRFTQPGGFNDPFELALEVYNPHIGEANKAELQFDTFPRKRCIDKYILSSDFKDDKCNDVFSRELISKLNDLIGILCLSKNPNSHLMWAHYADEYSGAVIEFDESHEYFTGMFEVKYSKERPIVHMDFFTKNKIIPLADLCIKPEEWSYENEWRLVRSLRNCNNTKKKIKKFEVFTHSIPIDAIKSVTLGDRCSLDTARKVYHKLKQTNIALSVAALANWKYEFRYEPIKFNTPLANQTPMMSPLTAEIFVNEKGLTGQIAKWIMQNHPMRNITKWRL